MAHEKRLLIDVFQAYFYRKNKDGNRELVFMSENLTSGSISSSQENTDVRNGQGNTLFAILPGNKDVTVNLTENVFSFEALKVNSAGKEKAGVAQGVTSNKAYRAGSIKPIDGTGALAGGGAGNPNAVTHKLIKLDKLPSNTKELVVKLGDVTLINGHVAGKNPGDPAISEGFEVQEGMFFISKNTDGAEFDNTSTEAYIVLVNADADKLATEKLNILPYVYITDDKKTKTLVIDAKTFSEGGELWLQTIEKDEKQKALAYVYFVFENAMPEGNFEISTVSEVQPNDMTVNMRILANEDGELYRIVREEIVQ